MFTGMISTLEQGATLGEEAVTLGVPHTYTVHAGAMGAVLVSVSKEQLTALGVVRIPSARVAVGFVFFELASSVCVTGMLCWDGSPLPSKQLLQVMKCAHCAGHVNACTKLAK